MSYICPNCGNDETFTARQAYTEWGHEDVYIDGEGSIDDYGDRDADDSESGDMDNIKCTECETAAE